MKSLEVKKTFFRKIFITDYNIGFSSPVIHACSKCIELSQKIKKAKGDEKASIAIEKILHKVRAKAFFGKIKETKKGMITFSFDCQKNLVNPKVPDPIAYYSR